MTSSRTARSAAQPPHSLPIFPLTGALLLPGGRLPLTIFEPRYIAMTEDALAGDRLIGMILPAESESESMTPPLFHTGCAGRIVAFAEEGERYLITLEGTRRFDLVSERTVDRGYRVAVADWAPYADDLAPARGAIDRSRLVAGLRAYFSRRELSADWNALDAVPDERLVTTIAMVCPFEPLDKQALLQARDLEARAKLLIGLVESAVYPETPPAGPRH